MLKEKKQRKAVQAANPRKKMQRQTEKPGIPNIGEHEQEDAKWPEFVREADQLFEESKKASKETTAQRLQTIAKRLEETQKKRWLWREQQDLLRERHMLETRMNDAKFEERTITNLEPFREALQSIPKATFTHYGQRRKQDDDRLRKLEKPSAETTTATATSTATATATATNRARPDVLLLTPANASKAVSLHLRSKLGCSLPPILLTVGDVCDDCGLQMCVIANDSMLGCPSCHKTRLLPNTTNATVSHGGEVDYSATSSHPKHRLPEWIEMAQAKQYAEPPQDVLELIVSHMIKRGATGLECFHSLLSEEWQSHGPFLDATDACERMKETIPDLCDRLQSIQAGIVRRSLRAIVRKGGSEKLRKFYEHSSKFASFISGFWPPRMNAQQEEVLRMLFAAAAPAYEARRKPSQHYWPGGFPYFLRSVCALKGWDEFMPLFPLPTGSREGGVRHALRKSIWEEDLRWEVVPAHAPLPPIQIRVAGSQEYRTFQLLHDDGMEEHDDEDDEASVDSPNAQNKKRQKLQAAPET